ncbi:MAG TPA: 4'-phosphopantetheinyl transferase superfamily protein [Mycobacteriales bacterium]
MIAGLLPASVRAVESFGPLPGATLLPDEEPMVERAVARRREEVTTVRACARRALAELGLPPAPILAGPSREPRWPPGVVGSLTHCAGYRAAAVARREDLAGLGIDAEPHAPLPDGVLDHVSLPEERAHLAALPPGPRWDRLLFSAKESVYKAWFPLAGRWLGFEDARLEFFPGSGTFAARLLVRDRPAVGGREVAGFAGAYAVAGGLLVTAIAVPYPAVPYPAVPYPAAPYPEEKP